MDTRGGGVQRFRTSETGRGTTPKVVRDTGGVTNRKGNHTQRYQLISWLKIS